MITEVIIMDFKRLEKNLCDNIYEAQLKLGYDKRPMSLNYMETSLKHLLGKDVSEEVLLAFADEVENRLGRLTRLRARNTFITAATTEASWKSSFPQLKVIAAQSPFWSCSAALLPMWS